MKIFLIIISIVILVSVGWLLASKTEQHQSIYPRDNVTTQAKPSIKSDKTPDFHLQDHKGKMVNLSDFAGKALVINSWASWCPFCKQELPDFVNVQKEFGNKIVIIAIDRTESLSIAKAYTSQQGTTDGIIFLLDPSDSFYQSIGGFSMPETIFVDKNGNIVDHKRGPMDVKEIRQKISKIL